MIYGILQKNNFFLVNIMPEGFDVIIPVYNEGNNIIELIKYLKRSSKKILNIYICYDLDKDTSIYAINNSEFLNNQNIILIKNLFHLQMIQ